MQPYKRKRRTRRDMITLGGWLFADLLLGLSLLFLVANTVGEGPPVPTPTPMPDYFATAESDIASNDIENQQTVVALESDLADSQSSNLSAQSTADALATRDAMSASQRATADANATNDAVIAQATIEALSTEQAENVSSQSQLNSDYATTVAEATNVAQQLQTQGTEQAQMQVQGTEQAQQLEAQGTEQAQLQQVQATEQAELRAASTANAQTGSDSRATIVALQQSQVQAAATSDSAVATTDAANNEVLAAQEQAQLNTLDPNAVPQTIQVDLDGVISGNDDAVDEARDELHRILDPYVNAETCRIGFVLLSSRAPTIGEGIQLSDSIADLIPEEFPSLLPQVADGEERTLASESIALPNTTPSGEVQLLLFLSAGCEPSAQVSPLPIAYIREAR